MGRQPVGISLCDRDRMLGSKVAGVLSRFLWSHTSVSVMMTHMLACLCWKLHIRCWVKSSLERSNHLTKQASGGGGISRSTYAPIPLLMDSNGNKSSESVPMTTRRQPATQRNGENSLSVELIWILPSHVLIQRPPVPRLEISASVWFHRLSNWKNVLLPLGNCHAGEYRQQKNHRNTFEIWNTERDATHFIHRYANRSHKNHAPTFASTRACRMKHLHFKGFIKK